MLDKQTDRLFDSVTQQSIIKLGRLIARKRKVLGWTLDETANYTGISKSLISALENKRAKSAPSMNILTRLIRVLDISPNEFNSCFYWGLDNEK